MVEPLNIVVLVDSLQNSYGTERAAASLCNELSKFHIVSIVSIEKQRHQCSFKIERLVEEFDLGITARLKLLKFCQMAWKIGRSAEIRNADVVISTLTYISIILLSLQRKSRIICWEHASYSYFGPIMNAIRINLYRKALVVITPTLSDSDAFSSKYVNSKSIANIVSTDTACNPSTNKNNCFLFVGRLSEEKGVEELLEILQLFYRDGNEITSEHTTFIVGDGPLFESAKRKIKVNSLTDRIKMVGRSDEISEYYQNADLLLCTSKSESFGLSIIEAAQHNVPTISFDDCLGPKALIKNNVNGFLIGSRDINKYASTLMDVHKNFDLLNDMGYKARCMSKAYDKTQIIASWLDLLDANGNA
jgi:glycosyltransferase involved in cell wall biosynthesis